MSAAFWCIFLIDSVSSTHIFDGCGLGPAFAATDALDPVIKDNAETGVDASTMGDATIDIVGTEEENRLVDNQSTPDDLSEPLSYRS